MPANSIPPGSSPPASEAEVDARFEAAIIVAETEGCRERLAITKAAYAFYRAARRAANAPGNWDLSDDEKHETGLKAGLEALDDETVQTALDEIVRLAEEAASLWRDIAVAADEGDVSEAVALCKQAAAVTREAFGVVIEMCGS
jgi:hypothetical protein